VSRQQKMAKSVGQVIWFIPMLWRLTPWLKTYSLTRIPRLNRYWKRL
jgi:hypothetical protein